MKKKIAAIGMAIILVFGISIGAGAASSLETISAYLNHGVHIKVNGQNFQAKDPDTGAALDPITYNGSTYLPLRGAAEAIGAGVGWDANSNSVELSSGSGGGGSVTYAFTKAGDHPESVLVSFIGEAKSTLDVAIYSLTLPEIVQAILDAKSRGVTVRVISDKTEAKTKSQAAALQQLVDASLAVKINTHSGLMHLKVTIVDGKAFTTGSFNYSKAASTTNDEVLLLDRDPSAASRWDAQFERMWNDTSGFANLNCHNPPLAITG